MIHRSSRRDVHRTWYVTLLLCLVILLCMAGITVAAVVGDQVELKASHQAGVPLHQELRGTNDFQRVPDGTRATVIEVAQDGRWVKLSLPDGRTGWVTSRYVSSTSASAPSTGTSPSGKKPQRIEEGLVERVADGDTITVITSNQTKLRIRMLGIDAPETPKGTKFPGQPYGPEAEAYLKRLVEGKRIRVEIFGVDRYKRLLSTIFIEGQDINLAMLEVVLAEVYRGPESGNPYKVKYQAAEETTRAAKKGMWVLGDKYESPRAYRKRVGIS
jgi:endonuclease YncB( thermonuclease family)